MSVSRSSLLAAVLSQFRGGVSTGKFATNTRGFGDARRDAEWRWGNRGRIGIVNQRDAARGDQPHRAVENIII